LSEGCTVVNYQGHGAPRQLADEVLLLSTDIPSLVNGLKLPVFLPLSCTVSEFDDPGRQSMCEDLIASTAGGAIATIGATTPTYVSANAALNSLIFQELFKNGATLARAARIVHRSRVRAVSESTRRTSCSAIRRWRCASARAGAHHVQADIVHRRARPGARPRRRRSIRRCCRLDGCSRSRCTHRRHERLPQPAG
jgi:hypothetical protein